MPNPTELPRDYGRMNIHDRQEALRYHTPVYKTSTSVDLPSSGTYYHPVETAQSQQEMSAAWVYGLPITGLLVSIGAAAVNLPDGLFGAIATGAYVCYAAWRQSRV